MPKVNNKQVLANVGWGKIIEDEINFNFHLTSVAFQFSWFENVSYSDVLDLKNALTNEKHPDLQLSTFPEILVTDKEKIVETLSDESGPLTSSNIQLLTSITTSLSAWISSILSNLINLSREPRELSKQLFFRSLKKIVVFESLTETDIKKFRRTSLSPQASLNRANTTRPLPLTPDDSVRLTLPHKEAKEVVAEKTVLPTQEIPTAVALSNEPSSESKKD